MKISIEPIRLEQKAAFSRMMELYLYDFTQFSNDDLQEDGTFGYPYIDAYWTEEGRYPFFIRADEKLAGLVLVRSCSEYREISNPHNIAEFFVMKKYRRLGIGKEAAMQVFDLFPGGWEVAVWGNNLPAQSFWEQVIKEYTKGYFETFDAENKEVTGFIFESRS